MENMEIEVENFLLRSKLVSHEEKFGQLQADLKAAYDKIEGLEADSDSGFDEELEREVQKRNEIIQTLEENLKKVQIEAESSDQSFRVEISQYLEQLEQAKVENVLISNKLLSVQESYEEMKFTVIKEKENVATLQKTKRIDNVRLEALSSIIGELTETVESKNDVIVQKSNVVSHLKRQKSNQDIKMRSVEEKLESVEVENLLLNSKLYSCTEELQDLHTQQKLRDDELKISKEIADQAIQAKSTEVQNALNNLSELKTLKKISDEKILQLEQEIKVSAQTQAQTEVLEIELQNAKNDLAEMEALKKIGDEKISQLEQEIKASLQTQAQTEALEFELQNAKTALVEMEASKKMYDEKISRLEQELKVSVESQSQSEALENELKNAKKELNEMDASKKMSDEKISKLEQEIKLSTQNEDLESELLNAKKVLEEMEATMKISDQRILQLERQLQASTQIPVFEKDLVMAKQQNQELSDKCNDLLNHVENLKCNEFLLQSKLSSFQAEKNHFENVILNAQNLEQERDQLRLELTSLKNASETMSQMNEKLSQDKAYFTQESQVSSAKISELEQNTQLSVAKVADLEQQREVSLSKINALEEELKEAQKENQDLVDRCADLVLRLESVSEDKETQTDEDLQAKITALIKEKEDLLEDIENVKAQNLNVVRDLSDKMHEYEAELNVKSIEICEKEKKITSLSEELTQKITAMESFSTKISHQESLIARMEASEAREAEILRQTSLKSEKLEGLLEQTEKDLVVKINQLNCTSVCLTEANVEIQSLQESLSEKVENMEILQRQHEKLQSDFTQVRKNSNIFG